MFHDSNGAALQQVEIARWFLGRLLDAEVGRLSDLQRAYVDRVVLAIDEFADPPADGRRQRPDDDPGRTRP